MRSGALFKRNKRPQEAAFGLGLTWRGAEGVKGIDHEFGAHGRGDYLRGAGIVDIDRGEPWGKRSECANR